MAKTVDKLEEIFALFNSSGHSKDVARAKQAGALSLVALCRQYTPRILPILFEIAEHGANADRLKAIQIILDRGFGKAPQVVEIVRRMSDKDVLDIAEAIAQKRRGRLESGPGTIDAQLSEQACNALQQQDDGDGEDD